MRAKKTTTRSYRVNPAIRNTQNIAVEYIRRKTGKRITYSEFVHVFFGLIHENHDFGFVILDKVVDEIRKKGSE